MFLKLLPYFSITIGVDHRSEPEFGVEINRRYSNALSGQVCFTVPKLFKPLAYYSKKRLVY